VSQFTVEFEKTLVQNYIKFYLLQHIYDSYLPNLYKCHNSQLTLIKLIKKIVNNYFFIIIIHN